MDRIKVLLVLDKTLAQRDLRGALEEYEDIQIVGDVGDAVEAMRQVTAVGPDVIVMDANIPYINGLETTRMLKGRGYPGAVVILSADALHLEEAVDSGATGYLLSEASDDELVAIIRRVLDGRFVFGGSVMNTTQGLEIASRHLADQGAGAARLQPRRPATPGTTEDAIAECAPGEALGDAPTGENDTTAEHLRAADRSARDLTTPASDAQDVAEPIDSYRTPTWDAPLREVELVFSHPAALTKVLELHQWLKEVSNAVINEMAGSPGGDTVLRASLGQPVPLMRLLSELREVASVAEEPYVGGSHTSRSVSGILGLRSEFGGGRTLPTRLRIVLTDE